MSSPSSCGWPDASNTGVNPLIARQSVSGTVNLSASNQVYQDKTVTGDIVVTGANVTIRNVKLIQTNGDYGIRVFGSNTNTVIQNVEINQNGNLSGKAIAFDNYTLDHAFIHNGADCAHFGGNVTITNTFCSVGPDANNDGIPDPGFGCPDGPHYDDLQSDGGNNIVIRHNTLMNPCGQTSAILMSTNTSGIRDVAVENNLMAGGGYTLYCDAGPTLGGSNHFSGNRFSKYFYPDRKPKDAGSSGSGFWGPTTDCQKYSFTGNVWDDTGAALSG